MQGSPTTTVSSEARQLAALAQDTARHAAELLRAEFALAKDEFLSDWQNAKTRALSLAVGALLLQVAVTFLALGVVLWLGVTATVVFATGGVLALFSLIIASFGARALHSRTIDKPKTQNSSPLSRLFSRQLSRPGPGQATP